MNGQHERPGGVTPVMAPPPLGRVERREERVAYLESITHGGAVSVNELLRTHGTGSVNLCEA